MTYQKITEELLKETTEIVVEHKKKDLEKERVAVLADKEKQIKIADDRIANIDAMLTLFTQ